MGGGDLLLWMVAAAITFGLVVLSGWQIWIHKQIDERISACDPTLLGSVTHKIETSTDAPVGSVVVPYVPVQMIPISVIENKEGPGLLNERNLE